MNSISYKGMVSFLISLAVAAAIIMVISSFIVTDMFANILAVAFAEITYLIMLFNITHFIYCQEQNTIEWVEWYVSFLEDQNYYKGMLFFVANICTCCNSCCDVCCGTGTNRNGRRTNRGCCDG